MVGDTRISIKNAVFKLFSSCTKNNKLSNLISDFRREVHEICVFLGYYGASVGLIFLLGTWILDK
jgi:hypothetical protein